MWIVLHKNRVVWRQSYLVLADLVEGALLHGFLVKFLLVTRQILNVVVIKSGERLFTNLAGALAGRG